MQNIDKLFIATKAYIEYQGKVLLLQESVEYADGTKVGKWDVPGGRLEPGESYVSALKREVEEETGLRISVGKPFVVGEWWPQVRGEHWQIVAIFFKCTANTNQVLLSGDHSNYEWVKADQIIGRTDLASFISESATEYIK